MIGIYTVDFNVTVSGGEGTKIFDEQGYLANACVKGFSGASTYQFEVVDPAGFGIAGTSYIVTGNHSARTDDVPLLGKNTFKIFNASEDGIYPVRLYIKYSYG